MNLLLDTIGITVDWLLLNYYISNFVRRKRYQYLILFGIPYVATTMYLISLDRLFLRLFGCAVFLFLYAKVLKITSYQAVKLLMIYFIFLGISEVIPLGIMLVIWGQYDLSNLFSEIIVFLETLLVTKFITFMSFYILKKFQKAYHRDTGRIENLVTILPLFITEVILIILVNNISLLGSKSISDFVLNIVLTSVVLEILTFLFIVFYEYYTTSKEQKIHLEVLKEENKRQYEYFQTKLDAENKIKEVYHDMKNHLIYIDYCFQNNITGGREYVNQVLDRIKGYDYIYETGNGMMDSLLNEYRNKCISGGIEFEARISFDEINEIDDLDLCIIFGNLLKNSYEASQKLEHKKNRSILLKGSRVGAYYTYKISNYFTESPLMKTKSGLPETSKADTYLHGIGLRNVRQTIEKYKGVLEIEVDKEKSMFAVILLLPVSELASQSI